MLIKLNIIFKHKIEYIVPTVNIQIYDSNV